MLDTESMCHATLARLPWLRTALWPLEQLGVIFCCSTWHACHRRWWCGSCNCSLAGL